MEKRHSFVDELLAIDSRSIREIDQEIRDEIEFHLTMRARANERAGMSSDRARRSAEEQFGNPELIFRECRRTLVGERIMLQRIQLGLIAALLVVVVALALQSFQAQRANEQTLDSILVRLQQLPTSQETSSPRPNPPLWEAERPKVVQTVPANGASDIDPAIREIRVTFDKKMTDGSWSWVRSSAEAFPESTGDVRYLDDQETCVMPVTLEPDTKYVVWLNTANYQNFKDREGRPAVPFLLRFTTAQ